MKQSEKSRFEGLSPGETVVDQFQYTVTGAGTGNAVVQITIGGANDAPTAVNDIPTVEQPSLYLNDRLTVTSVSATSQRGAGVAVVNGRIVYDPRTVGSLNALAAGQRLTDQFTYTIVDSHGATSSATVELVVQSPLNLLPSPVADSLTIGEDGFTGGKLLANDQDADELPGDAALATTTHIATSSLGARVIIATDGSFQYNASAVAAVQALQTGETIQDTFVYEIIDSQGGKASATATLTVRGANDEPVVANDQFLNVNGGSLLVVPASQGLLTNDKDVDSPLLIDLLVSDVKSAGGASVNIGPDGGFEYDPAGVLDYLPAGAVFEDSFTYTVVDDQGAMSKATVHLKVVGVNDPPVASDDGIERGYWTVPTQRLFIQASDGVLRNDTDIDLGDTARLQASFTGMSRYGAVVEVFADGSFAYDPTNSSVIQQFLEAGVDVVDSFTYTVTDGAAPFAANLNAGEGEGEGIGIQGVVEIILRSGPSTYSFNIVAQEGGNAFGGEFTRLGRGPSINNYGHGAFQGTRTDGRDNLYIWTDGSQAERRSGYSSLVDPAMLDLWVPPRGNFDAGTMARFRSWGRCQAEFLYSFYNSSRYRTSSTGMGTESFAKEAGSGCRSRWP